MADPTLVDMDFETQNDFPHPEFSLSTFTKLNDKIDSLLQISSPLNFGHSISSAISSRSFSPVTAPVSPPSRMAVALQTPRFPMWSGNPCEPTQHSVAQCIRQLSELSVSLYEHSTTVPPQSIHDHVPENELYQEAMDNLAQQYAKYSVDETFRLTQELIDIYPSFIEVFTRRKISHPSKLPRSMESSHLEESQSGEHLGPIAPPLSNPLHLDHSSILLILSCHLRLIDVYEQLFKHMKVCIEQKGVEYTRLQASFKAPQLKIGNYAPPITTALPMQMLLLLHFATSLCDRAVELEGHIREPQNGIGNLGSTQSNENEDGVAALSLASAEKVKERATGMLQHLSSLRTMMLREGHLA